MKIIVEHRPQQQRLDELGVESWPIWEKEISEFPWHYAEQEICYLMEGEVEVTPDGGESVRFGAGDLVTFPADMGCYWKITKAVSKYYRFG
jgi:uncharacterized cupin superfamily protein